MSNIVHVVVAVIIDENDNVCISLRHKDSHQGGLWEFPGGKIEQGETAEQALIREIKEELDLDVKQSRPLITINHNYQDERKIVFLHVRKVLSYHGEAVGVEGQQVKWVHRSKLAEYDFPAANEAIIQALQLPGKYLITGKFTDNDDFLSKLNGALEKNIKLVQLRLKDSDLKDSIQMQSLVEQAGLLCRQSDAKLMLNLSPTIIDEVDLSLVEYDGFHADSYTLKLLSTGAVTSDIKGKLFSASCHNRSELMQAVQLHANFAVLSPVQETSSHPDMHAIGWQVFAELIKDIPIPIYALGGVTDSDLETSWEHGAQGVAAISAFWK